MEPQALLRRMFDAAIASAQPALCIPPHLPAAPRGRLIVIGARTAALTRSLAALEDAQRESEQTTGRVRSRSSAGWS